jgi:hypothetical protein
MQTGLDNPFFVLLFSFLLQAIAACIGDLLRRYRQGSAAPEREDLETIRTATLTLLGLIIGFSFSMAISRYDQRKSLEEAEANAIGTEYVRADLLPADDRAKLRGLLAAYLEKRIAFYEARKSDEIDRIDAETLKLQQELWAAVLPPAAAQPTQVVALAVAGVNDVLNSQGYTQASWWNRIPLAAWALMLLIAICCNLLVGYSGRRRGVAVLAILPLIISIAFSLIADIDSPRGGVIRVLPQNLLAVAKSLPAL